MRRNGLFTGKEAKVPEANAALDLGPMPVPPGGGQYLGMSRATLACLAVTLVAACTGGPKWEKPGATPEMAAADLQQCRASAPLQPRAPLGPPNKLGMGGQFDNISEREAER